MKLFLKRGENRSFFFLINFLCMLLLHVCSLLSICFYFHTCIDVLFWVFQGRQVHFNQDLLPPFVTSELEVLVMEIKALLRRISFKYQLGRLQEHEQRSSRMYSTDSSKSYGLKQICGGPLSMIHVGNKKSSPWFKF